VSKVAAAATTANLLSVISLSSSVAASTLGAAGLGVGVGLQAVNSANAIAAAQLTTRVILAAQGYALPSGAGELYSPSKAGFPNQVAVVTPNLTVRAVTLGSVIQATRLSDKAVAVTTSSSVMAVT
jgi:hypothetical protein